MTNDVVAGLGALQTWLLIGNVFFVLSGAWFWLSMGLEALSDWLSARDYQAMAYRANEERHNDQEERQRRQLKAWTHDQAALKRSDRWNQ